MTIERRHNPRVFIPYFARLWGFDAAGQTWEEDVITENLSAGGLCVRLKRGVKKGTRIKIAVRLSTASSSSSSTLRLAARGVVVRARPQPNGTCDVAIEFVRRRLLMKANSAHSLC